MQPNVSTYMCPKRTAAAPDDAAARSVAVASR